MRRDVAVRVGEVGECFAPGRWVGRAARVGDVAGDGVAGEHPYADAGGAEFHGVDLVDILDMGVVGDGMGEWGMGGLGIAYAATIAVEFLAICCLCTCYAAAGVVVCGVEAVGVFGCAGFFALHVHFASA